MAVKILFLILLMPSSASATADSVWAARVQKLERKVKHQQHEADSLRAVIRQSIVNKSHLNTGEWILVFAPAVLFMGTLLLLRRKLREFKLRELLLDSELPRRPIANPEYNMANLAALLKVNPAAAPAALPPTIDISTDLFPKSSSRYLAFITSCLAWVITLVLTCFFIYEYIVTDTAPDLGGFASVLLSLGVGVAPYAFNKVASALRQ